MFTYAKVGRRTSKSENEPFETFSNGKIYLA